MRLLAVVYGVACYLLTGVVVLYMFGFWCDAWVPRSINVGEPSQPESAVIVNCMLIALFGLQHSVMARPAFKRIWTRLIPPPIERSTYVLFSNLALIVLFVLWRPL